MAIKLGEIFVSLGLSTASFTKGLNDAKKLAFGNAKEIERSLKIVGTAVAGMAIAAATGLFFLTKRAIDNADRMRDLALRAGTTVEVFSGLAFAAEQMGVSSEDLAAGLGKLSRMMGEAARGGKEQLQALSRVGISQKDLTTGAISLEQGLGKVIARLSLMPEGWQKSALAMQFFGKTGTQFNEFVAQGPAGIAKLIDLAKQLGRVISTETAVAADQFNDNLRILRGQLEGVGLGIANKMLPELNKLTATMVFASGSALTLGERIGEVGAHSLQGIIIGVQDLAINAKLASLEWKTWGKDIQLLFHFLSRGFRGGIGPEGIKLQGELAALKAETDGLLKLLALVREGKIGGALARHEQFLAAFAPKPKKGAPGFNEEATAAAKKLADAMQGIIAKLREEIVTFGMTDVALKVHEASLLSTNGAYLRTVRTLAIFHEMQKFMQKKLSDVAVVPVFQMPAGAEALDEVIEQAALQMADFAKNTERALEAMRGLGIEAPKIPKPLSEMQENMRIFALRSADALGEWLISGGSFRQVLQGIIQDLARMIFHTLVLRPLMNALFGGGGGGLFGGLFGGGGGGGFGAAAGGPVGNFGGGRAHGGPVFPGQAFMVGERGPELFVPKLRGDVVAHDKLRAGAGGGVTIVNNIDNRGADLGTTAKTAMLVNKLAMKQFAQLMQERQLRTA